MIEIKRTSEADAEILSELGKRTFIETFAKNNRPEDIDLYVTEKFSPEKQLREIQDPNRRIAIAWSAGSAVGFIHLIESSPHSSVTGTLPMELMRLYVDSQWHGKGVGPLLMEHGFQLARNEGFKTLWLSVWEKNFRAQSFYKKNEFKVIGQQIFRVGSDDQIDFIMARPL